MTEDDDWPTFSTDLSAALREHSARSLAAKANWGKTTVAEIKRGQRRPSRDQLEDLLVAARFDEDARRSWRARFDAAAGRNAIKEPPSSAPQAIEEVRPARDQAVLGTLHNEPRPERRRGPLPRRTLVVGACLLAVVLVVVGGLVWLGQRGNAVGVPTAQATPTPSDTSRSTSSTPSTSSEPSGTIDSPRDGASVGSDAGVTLKGSVEMIGGDTLWLVDRDPDGAYTADTAVDLTGPDTWSAQDSPIGDADELPQTLTILLIRADDRCAALLRRKVDAKDSSFDVLPGNCVVLDRVRVRVDRP